MAHKRKISKRRIGRPRTVLHEPGNKHCRCIECRRKAEGRPQGFAAIGTKRLKQIVAEGNKARRKAELSDEGRRRIIAAVKKRWAAYRAAHPEKRRAKTQKSPR